MTAREGKASISISPPHHTTPLVPNTSDPSWPRKSKCSADSSLLSRWGAALCAVRERAKGAVGVATSPIAMWLIRWGTTRSNLSFYQVLIATIATMMTTTIITETFPEKALADAQTCLCSLQNCEKWGERGTIFTTGRKTIKIQLMRIYRTWETTWSAAEIYHQHPLFSTKRSLCWDQPSRWGRQAFIKACLQNIALNDWCVLQGSPTCLGCYFPAHGYCCRCFKETNRNAL